MWSSYNHGGDHGDMTGGWFMIVLTKHIRGYNHQEWNHGDIIGISWGYVANNADMIETWRKKWAVVARHEFPNGWACHLPQVGTIHSGG